MGVIARVSATKNVFLIVAGKHGKETTRVVRPEQNILSWKDDLARNLFQRSSAGSRSVLLYVCDCNSIVETSTAPSFCELWSWCRLICSKYRGYDWNKCGTYLEWEVGQFHYWWAGWCVQDSISTFGLIESKEANDIINNVRSDVLDAYASVAHYEHPFQYVC